MHRTVHFSPSFWSKLAACISRSATGDRRSIRIKVRQRIGGMDKDYLILKRASTSRPSGEWSDDDFDVLCDGVVVGR
jgi:hypothetical protein